ncbi:MULTISPECIES: hypothetical protein [Empedobacter]|uniref:hypothetical protein n=1 Tax=Empedobacter TaxID=59734 RepID=UPI00257560CC|nr:MULTISPECIES: hypothetical protein [Empedobacter]MDM1042118.1 hypothetical protein [Empedobacter brevis]MDM1136007.1 hypothetical protein [Empedobacter sp. R750]
MNFVLVILAKLLYIAISPINFIYVIFIKKRFSWKRLNGYFRENAVSIDRFGNSQYRSLFNAWFVAEKGYHHGNINETISSVLGKNEYFGTLTKTGKVLVSILNFIDKDHCAKSIDWDVK